jgi:hypothetical protein
VFARLLADSFYDSVLREGLAALGAALFFANAWALVRRRADAEIAAERSVARHRPGSPVRGYGRAKPDADLAQAPVARTTAYMIVGFVVMIVGIGAILNK